jgi:myosin heavy subunit
LELLTPQDYYYLSNSECYTAETVDDAHEWGEVIKAFDVLNFTDEERLSLFRVIAGILHLGNVVIGQDNRDCCTFPEGDKGTVLDARLNAAAIFLAT